MANVWRPRAAEPSLAGFRFALAAGAWLTPRLTGRLFGLEPDANPVSPYLARLFGARAGWLGAEIVLASAAPQRRQVITGLMTLDAVDLPATVLGRRAGYLTRRGAVMTAGGALTALGLAGAAIRA